MRETDPPKIPMQAEGLSKHPIWGGWFVRGGLTKHLIRVGGGLITGGRFCRTFHYGIRLGGYFNQVSYLNYCYFNCMITSTFFLLYLISMLFS